MVKYENLLEELHPLALGPFSNWVKLLRDNNGVDSIFGQRARRISLLSILTSPLRAIEHNRFGSVIQNSRIDQAPIFIIGHWRSGTTWLHNLLTQDTRFGYVSTWQAVAPGFSLLGDRVLKPLVNLLLPPTRMMDNMAWSLDSPQEEEFAMVNLLPYSFYHQWSFPRKAREYFRKYVLWEGVSRRVQSEWENAYIAILKKATLRASGRRLVTKNPVNTGRIETLLEIFPDAKFIFLYRNPYTVYPSTQRLYQKTLRITQLQDVLPGEVDANILWFYQQLMKKYLGTRDLIPPENLLEIRFEDLEAAPLLHLRRIYEKFNLQFFRRADRFSSVISLVWMATKRIAIHSAQR